MCEAHTRCIAQQALSFSLTHTHTRTHKLSGVRVGSRGWPWAHAEEALTLSLAEQVLSVSNLVLLVHNDSRPDRCPSHQPSSLDPTLATTNPRCHQHSRTRPAPLPPTIIIIINFLFITLTCKP